jgi:hypothetical protein
MSGKIAGDGLKKHVINYVDMKEVVLRRGIHQPGVLRDIAGLIGNFIVNRILVGKLEKLIVLIGTLLLAEVTDIIINSQKRRL